MRARQRIAVVGAGGFARDVRWLIQDLAQAGEPIEFAGFVVSDLSKLGPHDSRDGLLGDLSELESPKHRIDALALGIGMPEPRVRLSEELSQRFPHLAWPALIHPTVVLARSSATIGRGVQICAGAIASVNVTLEPFCMVNHACTVGHEAHVGRGSVLNPSVNVSGGVRLGSGVLVGTGAQVLQYLNVGDNAVVGAGAVVTRDVDPGVTVVGVPARPLERAAA